MYTHLSKNERTKKITFRLTGQVSQRLHLEKATDPADWASLDYEGYRAFSDLGLEY